MEEEEIPTRRAWAAREKERKAEEQARRAAENERRYAAEEKRREAEEKAKLPVNRLYRAYVGYAHIQLCDQERKGYAVTYINDVELQRARAASKAIENAAVAEDPKIDRDKLFAEADKTARSLSSGRDACQSSLTMLLAMSPVSPYQTQRP
jgi:hypothetical protein